MKWNFVSDRPIYTQIVESMELFIASGELEPGEKVLPVRELAAEAEVNPNTMQRALAELERRGLLFTNRTSGRFVTEDKTVIEAVKISLAHRNTADYLLAMEKLGYQRDGIVELVKNFRLGDEEK